MAAVLDLGLAEAITNMAWFDFENLYFEGTPMDVPFECSSGPYGAGCVVENCVLGSGFLED